jgi:hypothetical protein
METQANEMSLKFPDWSKLLSEKAKDKLLSIQRALKREGRKPVRPEDLETNLYSVRAYLSTLVDIFHLFGMRKPNRKEDNGYYLQYEQSLRESEEIWMDYSDSKGKNTSLWKDLGKWKACTFFAVVFNQTFALPPLPKGLTGVLAKPRFLLSGVFRVFLKQIISCNRETLKTFAVTILQSKKGAPALAEKHVLKSRFDTFVQLTTPPTIDHPIVVDIQPENEWYGSGNDFEDYSISKTNPTTNVRDDDWNVPLGAHEVVIDEDWIKDQLRRTTLEIFGRISIEPDDIYYPIFPSTSANYRYGRLGMGAVSTFYDLYPEAGKCDRLMRTNLGHVNLSTQLPSSFGQQRRDEEALLFDLQREKPIVKESLALLFDPSEIEEKWKEAYDCLYQAAWEECPLTKTIGLTEPFKVRVITCGPPATYTVLHSFQKFLWKTLRRHKVFQLIGEVITADIVFGALGYLEMGYEFISGDYVASTDRLKSWVSETINESLFVCLLENSKNVNCEFLIKAKHLCKRALTGHFIENPIYGLPYEAGVGISPEVWEDMKNVFCLPQRNGQLMGSIISFIYLCIANAALCRGALELSNQCKYTLKKAPLLVNGDDCVLKCRSFRGRILWENITRMAGLSSSVGKTYYSRDFAVMNSVHFDYNHPSWESGPSANPLTERKYVNIGLVYGQKRSGQRGKKAHVLGELHKELFRTCPKEYWNSAAKLFIERNRVALDSFKVPWYLPQWLGGLGLVRPSGWDDNFDRMVSHSIMISMKKKEETFSFDIPRLISEDPLWAMYRLVLQDLRKEYKWLGSEPFHDVEYEGTTRTLSEEALKLRRWLIIELLFTNPRGEPDGYGDDDPRRLFLGSSGPSGGMYKDILTGKMVKEYSKTEKAMAHNAKCWAIHVKRLLEDPVHYKKCYTNRPDYSDLLAISLEIEMPVFEERLAVLSTA